MVHDIGFIDKDARYGRYEQLMRSYDSPDMTNRADDAIMKMMQKLRDEAAAERENDEAALRKKLRGVKKLKNLIKKLISFRFSFMFFKYSAKFPHCLS